MEPTVTARADLAALRQRRAELRESMHELEAALAAPASGRAPDWGARVSAALDTFAEDFDEHIAVTEGPDGLHQSILAGDLRLANAVAALAADHVRIAAEVAALVGEAAPPLRAEAVAGIRERGTQLLGQVARHRQTGADLIYEAFVIDLGGGD
jgi:hypothetical protein